MSTRPGKEGQSLIHTASTEHPGLLQGLGKREEGEATEGTGLWMHQCEAERAQG